MTTIAALNAALTNPAIGSAPVPGDGAIDDHGADALLTAAWLRANAHRAALWQTRGLTTQIAQPEGWPFGVVSRMGRLRGAPGSLPHPDRLSVVWGKRGSVCVDLGVCRNIKEKPLNKQV